MHHKHPAKHAIANSQRLSRARCLGKWKSGGTGDSLMWQINNYCQNVKEFTSQNLGKLFMAEALQGHN
uniref:eIF3h C-terminal domain-containing protein n=1 Tax=Haplochromis burtoni TaxID=8153 RepID=A0A3Q3CR87_HAPBU